MSAMGDEKAACRGRFRKMQPCRTNSDKHHHDLTTTISWFGRYSAAFTLTTVVGTSLGQGRSLRIQVVERSARQARSRSRRATAQISPDRVVGNPAVHGATRKGEACSRRPAVAARWRTSSPFPRRRRRADETRRHRADSRSLPRGEVRCRSSRNSFAGRDAISFFERFDQPRNGAKS